MRVYNLILILLFSISCGKKAQEVSGSSTTSNPSRTPLSNSLSKFISKQSVYCEDDKLCPESVAKLVVIEREKIRYCTGVLIGKDTMMTSSSCLPLSLTAPELDCSKNIFAIFPKTNKNQALKVQCHKIIRSHSNNTADAALWNKNYTFFSLVSPIDREASALSRKGLDEGKLYRTWKVNYESDTEAILKSENCKPLFNTYANPLAKGAHSPSILVSGCSFQEGNSGAPLFNENQEVVSIYSTKLSETLTSFIMRSNLLIAPMSPMHFVSNTSCSKYDFGNNQQELNQECFKSPSRYNLDKLRSNLLFTNEIHKDNFELIRNEIESSNKYFQWNLVFLQSDEQNKWEAHIDSPKCFYDIKSWIGDFTRLGGFIRSYGELDFKYPLYKVATKLDHFLRPISVIDEDKTKAYKVKFNPKSAYNEGKTYLNLSTTLFDRNFEKNFQDISDKCD